MSVIDRVDGFQRRHPVLGYPIAVVYKFFDDAGGYLAALMTYYAFVSLFPLLLLFATILSIVLKNRQDLQQQILNSALSQLPVVGKELGDPQSLNGGWAAIIIGLLLALYGTLGIGNAFQYAMNMVWAIPRNARPNPLFIRVRSLLLVVTAGVAIVATTVVSAISSAASDWGGWVKVASIAATVIVNTGIVYLAFRLGTRGPARHHLLPGAIIVAVVWQLLQYYGVVIVGRIIKNASDFNGVVGFVLGMIVFIYVASVIVVIAAEINVVTARSLYPRSLLGPFTDNVELTAADVETYTRQARTMRTKGYERIDIDFGPDQPR